MSGAFGGSRIAQDSLLPAFPLSCAVACGRPPTPGDLQEAKAGALEEVERRLSGRIGPAAPAAWFSMTACLIHP